MLQFGANFKSVMFFFWIDADEVSKNFWATAKQIGRLLGLRRPHRAIERIVSNNPCACFKPMEITFSDGEVKTLYSFKDMLKICKYSKLPQKVLDEVVDFLWDIAEEVPTMLESSDFKKRMGENEESKDISPEDNKCSAEKEDVPDNETIQVMKEIRHELSHLIYNIGELRKEIKALQKEKEEGERDCNLCPDFELCPSAFLVIKGKKC